MMGLVLQPRRICVTDGKSANSCGVIGIVAVSATLALTGCSNSLPATADLAMVGSPSASHTPLASMSIPGLYAALPQMPKRGKFRKGGGVFKVGNPYVIKGKTYYPRRQPNYVKTGIASWYGTKFHGRKTANGEIFDKFDLTAAHKTLPLPSLVKVTNLANGRTIVVRVNDRGPYANDRVIDLSKKSAHLLGFLHKGTARVRVQVIGKAPISGDDSYERRYLAKQRWYRKNFAALVPATPAKTNYATTGNWDPIVTGSISKPAATAKKQ